MLDDSNVEPVDGALLSKIRNLSYVTKYNFNDDNSPLSPINIAGMELADLVNLKNKVRFKMQTAMLKSKVGDDDNTLMQYCNDLLQFINVVEKFKKTSTKSQLAQYSPSPSYQIMKSRK